MHVGLYKGSLVTLLGAPVPSFVETNIVFADHITETKCIQTSLLFLKIAEFPHISSRCHRQRKNMEKFLWASVVRVNIPLENCRETALDHKNATQMILNGVLKKCSKAFLMQKPLLFNTKFRLVKTAKRAHHWLYHLSSNVEVHCGRSLLLTVFVHCSFYGQVGLMKPVFFLWFICFVVSCV